MAPAARTGRNFSKRLVATKSVDGKASACVVRRYDANHLAHHPQQTVSAIKRMVSVEPMPEDEQLHYAFRFGVKFRKQPGNFETGADCGRLRLHCSVDCDGGGIEVSLAATDKSVVVRLDEIRLDPAEQTNQASMDGAPDHDGHVIFRAGAEDCVFQLDRTDIAHCKSLAPADGELAARADK